MTPRIVAIFKMTSRVYVQLAEQGVGFQPEPSGSFLK
jgi:hypothetical protein